MPGMFSKRQTNMLFVEFVFGSILYVTGCFLCRMLIYKYSHNALNLSLTCIPHRGMSKLAPVSTEGNCAMSRA